MQRIAIHDQNYGTFFFLQITLLIVTIYNSTPYSETNTKERYHLQNESVYFKVRNSPQTAKVLDQNLITKITGTRVVKIGSPCFAVDLERDLITITRMVETLLINSESPNADHLERAKEILAGGGLVIVPTETVYGLACDPSVAGAMEKLVAAKGRDGDKPVARLAATPEQVHAEAVAWNAGIQALAECYWPGPLTLVLETAVGWTGYRISDHPVALALAIRCEKTLALTSANLSGEPDTKTAAEAAAAVSADLILDSGPSAQEAIPSTVVKVNGSQLECLREGCLSFEKILTCFKKGLS
jgi:L-threonylcarbamoyladenylate synthase